MPTLAMPGAKLHYEERGSGPLLAEALGVSPVTFPGGHVGFQSHPDAFAEVLAHVLGS